jgi:hypothetical protein
MTPSADKLTMTPDFAAIDCSDLAFCLNLFGPVPIRADGDRSVGDDRKSAACVGGIDV